VIGVARCVVTEHTFSFVLSNGLLPASKMVIKQLTGKSVVGIFTLAYCGGASRISQSAAWGLAILANWTRPRILVKVHTLLDVGL
jgi:hypothetical protein